MILSGSVQVKTEKNCLKSGKRAPVFASELHQPAKIQVTQKQPNLGVNERHLQGRSEVLRGFTPSLGKRKAPLCSGGLV